MLQQGASSSSSKAKRKRPADSSAGAPANGKKETLRAVPLLEEMPKWSVVREILQVVPAGNVLHMSSSEVPSLQLTSVACPCHKLCAVTCCAGHPCGAAKVDCTSQCCWHCTCRRTGRRAPAGVHLKEEDGGEAGIVDQMTITADDLLGAPILIVAQDVRSSCQS